jgi:DNA-binding NarL/FixJ family response regulator
MMDTQKGGRREIPQLSPREQEVFLLVAQGLTNIQIGKKLFIGEKTVKNYVTKIRKKLGLAHRTQIALYALQEGLLDLSQLPDLESRGDFDV